MGEVVLQPTIDHIIRMMKFLHVNTWAIPSYNMSIPEDISEGPYYRPNMVFRILLSDVGRKNPPVMSYYGSGLTGINGKADVYKYDVPMDQKWIDRAFVHLAEDVKKEVKLRAQRGTMDGLDKLLLKFSKLDFVPL